MRKLWHKLKSLTRFPSMLFVSLIALGGLWAYFLVALGSFAPKDVLAYRLLTQEKSQEDADSYISKQARLGLRKDISFHEKGHLLHMCLNSRDADLVLEKHAGRMDVVEHMRRVNCILQEELFYLLPDGSKAATSSAAAKPMQHVFYLEADDASYYYREEKFIAENARLMRYTIAGHAPVSELAKYRPYASGKASHVEFSLGGKGLNLKADHFKATLFSDGGLP